MSHEPQKPVDLDTVKAALGRMTPGPWHAGHFGDETISCDCRYILDDGHCGGVGEVYVDNGFNIMKQLRADRRKAWELLDAARRAALSPTEPPHV